MALALTECIEGEEGRDRSPHLRLSRRRRKTREQQLPGEQEADEESGCTESGGPGTTRDRRATRAERRGKAGTNVLQRSSLAVMDGLSKACLGGSDGSRSQADVDLQGSRAVTRRHRAVAHGEQALPGHVPEELSLPPDALVAPAAQAPLSSGASY